jgi:hypothetical protein
MRTRTSKTLATLLALLALSTLVATPASAEDDFPDTAVSDSVAVYGQVTATGYSGTLWWRNRTTVSDTFHGSALVGTPSGNVPLAAHEMCAADYMVASQSFVVKRQADGNALVSFIMWTWDDCPFTGHHGSWQQQYVWVAAGDSETIHTTLRSNGGGTTARVTFTNYWTPKIDTSKLTQTIPKPIEPASLSGGFRL